MFLVQNIPFDRLFLFSCLFFFRHFATCIPREKHKNVLIVKRYNDWNNILRKKHNRQIHIKHCLSNIEILLHQNVLV